MTDWDVFNGDADGICALIQLRLADPRPDARLVTGIKRDIKLVRQVSASAGDRVTVLDLSLAKNRDDVVRLLDDGAEVLVVDHHDPGRPISHPRLTTEISTKGEMCTSWLVNRRLGGRHSRWAAVGAFGDNMGAMGEALCRLTSADTDRLRELGRLTNYNAYGQSLDDLHFHPEHLFRSLLRHSDPHSACDTDDIARLRAGYGDDMAATDAAVVLAQTDDAYAALLPDTASSRRISGIWGNQLARQHPDRAHAVLTARPDDGFTVSIRAPLATRKGALALSKRFPTGGGRPAAAGINRLPAASLPDFLEVFQGAFVPARKDTVAR